MAESDTDTEWSEVCPNQCPYVLVKEPGFLKIKHPMLTARTPGEPAVENGWKLPMRMNSASTGKVYKIRYPHHCKTYLSDLVCMVCIEATQYLIL